MKKLLTSIAFFPLVLHAEVIQIGKGKEKENYENQAGELGKKVNIVPFRKFFPDEGLADWQQAIHDDNPYSSALGVAAWKSKGTHLAEVSVAPKLTEEEYTKDIKDNLASYIGITKDELKTWSDEAKAAKIEDLVGKVRFIEVTQNGKDLKPQLKNFSADETKDRQLTTRLGIFNECGQESGSAVLFSIRNAFSLYNLNQEGAAIDYTNTDGKGSLKLKGALTADIFLDPLYNGRWRPTPWYINNPYRFSLRTGVEFEQDDTATTPTDRTSFYLLANFQANPDQNIHLLGINNLWSQVTSPQFVQIGAALDHDEFTGDDDLRWILGWQPRLYVITDNDVWFQTFGINHIMRYAKDASLFNPALKRTRDRGKEGETFLDPKTYSPWYSYIPADIKLTGGSAIWDKLSKGDDLDKASLEWQLGFIIGNSDYRYRFGYKAESVSPISNIGNTHIGHSLFAEIGLGNISGAYAKSQRERDKDDNAVMTDLTDADLGVMTVFAKYTMGEFAPTFENQEIFQIGTRVRF